MRVLIDACVLYPTVLREIVLGVAARGLFSPLWSARLLEEWARATVKLGSGAQTVARGEIAVLRVRWPGAEISPNVPPQVLAVAQNLPDPDDLHVLAAAVGGQADTILTLNLRDFPTRVLAPLGLRALAPDPFLLAMMPDHPAAIAAEIGRVHDEAERLAGTPLPLRAFLKRSTLPRLARALAVRE